MIRTIFAGLIGSALTIAALGAGIAAPSPAFADASNTAMGSVSGTIMLDTGTNIGPGGLPPDATVRVDVVRSKDLATKIGQTKLGDVKKGPNGERSIAFTVSGLPLGEPIRIHVEPVQPAGASPLPTGFAWLVHFHPSAGNGFDEVTELTLTATAPSATGIDFSAYGMEVPPMPPESH